MPRFAVALAIAASLVGRAFAQCPPQSSAAAPSSPSGPISNGGGNITYTWTAPSGSGVAGFQAFVSNGTGCTAAPNATSCSGPSLAAGTYSWAVKTFFTGCTGGVDSNPITFTVNCPVSAPTPQSPSNGATNISTNVQLNWSTVIGADTYDVYLGAPGAGCTANSPLGTTSNTNFSPPQLQPSTDYEWKVVAKKSTCPTRASACVTFHTAAQTCNAPGSFNLTSPANNATVTTTPTLTWSASSGAEKYVVRLSTSNPPQPSANDAIISASAGTSYKPTLAPGTYYWYVDAFPTCSTLVKTSTQVSSFTVASSCPDVAPTLISPTAGAQLDATQAITFKWNGTPNATGYDVDVSNDSGANFTSIGTTSGATATSLTKSLPAGRYVWVVRALYGNNCAPVASGLASFSVVTPANCPTAVPTLLLPANNATNVASPVTFDWSDVDGATSYRLIAMFNGGSAATIATTVDSKAVNAIPAGTAVEWWVEVNAGTTCPAVASQHFKFGVAGSPCSANTASPAIVSPANGASVTSPVTLQWTAVSGASSYRVFATVGTSTEHATIGTTTNTQLTVTLPQGAITWIVEALFTNCPSTFSPTSTFTVTTPTTCNGVAPALQSPANGAKNVTSPVTFQWNAAPGATKYKLFLGGSSATETDDIAETSETQVTNVSLPAGGYFWFVVTSFAGCPDVRSSVFTFTIPAATQCGGGTLTISSPANGATVTSPVLMQWTALQGVAAYRIWATAGNTTAPAVLLRTTNTAAPISLPSGAIEAWVEGLFTDCPSVLSPHINFTVQQATTCGSNTAPTPVSPINNAGVTSPATFTWTAVPNAVAYRVWASGENEPFVDIGLTRLTTLTHAVESGNGIWYVEALFDNCPPVASARATFVVAGEERCGSDSPMIVSPANGAQNVASPVTLVWSAVPNAEEYRVFASLDNGETFLIAKTDQASVTKNIPPGTVKWAVEAVFDECPSTRSAPATFTIARNQNCPTAPAQLVSPPDGAQNVAEPVRFDWNPVSGASGYLVTARHNDGVPTRIGETTDTQLQRDVPPGNIEWFVTTFFTNCPPLESAHFTFNVPPPPECGSIVKPLLVSPPDSSTPIGSNVHFAWTRVPRAKSYKVWLSVDGATPTVFGTTTDNKLIVDVPAGVVIWFVEGDFDNCPPTKSAPGTFVVRKSPATCTTPDRPHASVAGQAASGTPYDVRWTPLDNVTNFELEEAQSTDFSNATTQVITGQQASFTHTATTAPQRYFYRVRGVSNCSDERGSYSRAVSIVIVPPNATATTTHHSSVQVGTENGITQQVLIPGVTPPVSFTARGDKPWISVAPPSGTLGPDGVTLTVTFDAAAINLGTNTGTILLTYGSSGKGIAPHGASPSGVPVSVSLVSPVSPGGKNTPPPDALIIPAVGHAPGANNSLFESDVRVCNTSAQLQKYSVTFTLTGTDGTQSSSSASIQIDPGATFALDDILASFFGIGADNSAATGVLEIRPSTSTTSSLSSSTTPSITTVASSRTYNNTSTGTYGQYIPAIPFSQFIAKSATSTPTLISLQQVANSAAYRTNFGMVEAAGQAATTLIHVFDNAGNELAQIPQSLKAGEQIQLNGFLANNHIDLTDGRIEVEVTSSTGKVTAYASVVDNQTNDPLLVLPVVKGGISSTHYVLPGIADINTGAANWRSDVRIFNAGANEANVTIAFVPLPGYTATSQTITYNLKPGEVKVIDNAVQNLFGLTNTGGTFVLTSDAAASLIATARTYNQTSTGTYGQFIPAISPSESVGVNDRALQVLQLESSTRFRTNVGITETTGNPATVVVTAVTPDSKVSASTTIALAPNDFRQFSLDSFGLGTIYNTRVSVKVIDGTGRVTAYGSVIDQQTQDPTYVLAQ